ncbi:MAG: undecaprenyl/decaprenyl-phosphate alpha-N-acetylglucosaminyl 1-phosphate transferase [Ruminococcaceae bacterium]|nr:undecaprenyl/decaprenyl-phosphate alpha-N-acetylglucosaminyl 1-phosphate transferase [Oscillospiraceae bacterium]
MSILSLILCFSLAFGLSFVSTPLVRKMAFKMGAVDVPDGKRRIHKKSTPLIGGLAIFYGAFISILCFYRPLDEALRGILLGSIIIVAMGIVDDTVELKASKKLIFQLLAALIVALNGVQIRYLSVPDFLVPGGIFPLKWASIPVTVIWIIAVTNAVNLIDGLDGLAAGVSSIATFSLFFIAILMREPTVAILSAALAGACVGFLPFNFNPAKIFMGDTGAQFLGFMLSVICIQGLFKGYLIISFVAPFLVLGLPIFDTLFAIIRRLWNKKPVMAPDRGHLHHKLMDMGFSQKQAVAILYVLSTLLGLTAVVMVEKGAQQAIWIVISVLVVIAFSIYLTMHREKTLKQNTINDENEENNND